MNSSKMIALFLLTGLVLCAVRAGDDKEPQPEPAIQIADRLINGDPPDLVTNCVCKVHILKLQAGKTYLISLSRKDNNQPFNPWLRIEDSNFKQLVSSATFANTVRTRFTPPKDEEYRIIASCQGGQGEYLLRIAPDQTAKFGVNEDGFLLRWLALAPIPLAANQTGADAVGKEQIKNEAELKPSTGQRMKVGDKEFVWKEHIVSDFLLDFNSLLGARTEDAVAYAVTYVVAPEELRGIKMKAGSDDQLKIYLNGKEVMKFTGSRAALQDQETAEVTLRKGVNVLAAKVVNEKGDWGLCVRFTDKNDRPLTELKCKTAP